MDDKTALITGIGGFAGGYLTEHLIGQGVRVVGTIRPGSRARPDQLAWAELVEVDLDDADRVATVVEQVRPDMVFHLAAQSAPSQSWADPAGTLVHNVLPQLWVLQAVVKAGLHARIVAVGSGEEYGLTHPHELPIRETNELRPINPYGVSKVAQDVLAYQFCYSHQLQCVRIRPFNHTGPRQSPVFAIPAFAQQVAEAEAGLREPIIRVGNLEAKRDFTDVRDIVRGYYLAALHGQSGEAYNLGSGRPIAMADVLDYFVSHSRRPVTIVPDPALQRPADIPVMMCDFGKFHALTGWRPEIPLERTLADTLDYWRAQVRATSTL